MDEEFDVLARRLAGDSISRRRTLGLIGSSIFGGVLGSLAFFDDAGAKKKKKKKKKKTTVVIPPTPVTTPAVLPVHPPTGAPITCNNVNTACGFNTLQCNCRVTRDGHQVCLNTVIPPNGAAFAPCQTSLNCQGEGEYCDNTGGVCRMSCRTG